MAQVMVTIDGRSYRMACDDGQEPYIQDLASNLDKQVMELRKQFGAIGDMRLLLMASLIQSDDVRALRERVDTLEQENHQLKTIRSSLLDQSFSDQQHNAHYLESCADRIHALVNRIENPPKEAAE